MGHKIVPVRTYLIVWAALMLLLALTAAAHFLNLGAFAMAVALAIGIAKAVLIVLYFMHVRHSSRLTGVLAAAGFVWLLLLIAGVIIDYASRSWVATPGY